MLIVSLHGLGYYIVWMDQGNWTGALSWNARNTNLLAGVASWLHPVGLQHQLGPSELL